MLKTLKIFMASMCILSVAATAFPGWMMYKRAELRNTEMSVLRIDTFRSGKNGKVRAWLMLSEKTKGVFSSKAPIYQVDDGPVHTLASAPGLKTDNNAEKWIYWEIWDGKGAASPGLLEFINGKSAVFQYYLPGGEIREATFLLEGAKEAIEELLD